MFACKHAPTRTDGGLGSQGDEEDPEEGSTVMICLVSANCGRCEALNGPTPSEGHYASAKSPLLASKPSVQPRSMMPRSRLYTRLEQEDSPRPDMSVLFFFQWGRGIRGSRMERLCCDRRGARVFV